LTRISRIFTNFLTTDGHGWTRIKKRKAKSEKAETGGCERAKGLTRIPGNFHEFFNHGWTRVESEASKSEIRKKSEGRTKKKTRRELRNDAEFLRILNILGSPQLGLQTVKTKWPQKGTKGAKTTILLLILRLLAATHLYSISPSYQ
jgi:hypothetical protein